MTTDHSESKSSTKILFILAILILGFIAGMLLLLPDLSNIADEFQNGVGLKDAAIYSFFTTLVLMVILTVVSGDGLIAELPFLLIGFLVFFIIIWLFIAWIF